MSEHIYKVNDIVAVGSRYAQEMRELAVLLHPPDSLGYAVVQFAEAPKASLVEARYMSPASEAETWWAERYVRNSHPIAADSEKGSPTCD